METPEVLETKFLEAEVIREKDGLTAVASTNTIDRHGEVVDNNGWDLKAYKKNPVILWAHDHGEPAIGSSIKTWVTGEGKQAKLMIKPVFHGLTERSAAMKALYEGTPEMKPVMNSFSVGFRPIESPDGVTFTKNELLEVSAVNVPANADAMMMAYKGLKKAGFKDEVLEDIGVKVDMTDRLVTMQQDIEELKTLVKAAPVNPKKRTEERLSMLKVVAKATDKLLEAEKKEVEVDHRRLLKAVKRATEIMAVAEKKDLHG